MSRASVIGIVALCLFCAPYLVAQQQPVAITVVCGSKAATPQAHTHIAGEPITVHLTARDGNGDVIRDWDQTGSAATITLYNSDANTDTSTRSWNEDPDGYTWAMFFYNGQPLPHSSPYGWTLPPSVFTDGTTELEFVHTKTGTGISYEITPPQSPLSQKSDEMTFVPAQTSSFLVQLTNAVPGKTAVFHMRKYEITVVPRDRYMNVTDEVILTKFSARFPGEFLNSQPGYSGLFGGAVYLQGATNYFLASTTKRELGADQLQWIMAYSEADPDINGIRPEYEVLTHAPLSFRLFNPPDKSWLLLQSHTTPQVFDWERSDDAYSGITVSNTTGEIASDVVRYTIHFVDSLSLTREVTIDSDDLGSKYKWTTTHGQLAGIVQTQGGDPFEHNMIWFVEATDGFYITRNVDPNPSVPQIGFRLKISPAIPHLVESLRGAASSFLLHQNYPNPFNPSTTIRFEIVERGHVTLRVYDLLGNQVAELANETLDPGVYSTEFNASGLASGVYTYTLQIGNRFLSKQMIIEK